MGASAELDRLFDRLRNAGPREAARVEVEIWQRWTRSGDARIDAWMNRGIEAMGSGNHSEALEAFDSIVRAAPGFAEGWNKRATLYWLLGEHEASVHDIERTLALEPRHFGALSGLAMIRQEQGQVFDALDALERIARIHPHMPQLDEWMEDLSGGLAEAT